MKIHLIGHATLFVETQDCTILMDPVFQDPFCEGLNASCPRREVHSENIPDFDFLVISHQHLDHFDIPTLSTLPKHVDVFIPQDPVLESCLQQLGFQHVYPLGEFAKVRFGKTTLMTSRSEVRVPEFGVVIADESGVFWNTVDTLFAPETIQAVRENFPCIDFLLTTWHVSMEGRYQYHQDIAFPYTLYGYLFNLISLIQPKAIAPGASGFKYIGSSAWQNQLVFPVTRERFCHDLATAFPEISNAIYPFDPGDVIQLENQQATLLQAASPYATMMESDRSELRFAPVVAGNPMVDSNPAQIPEDLLNSLVQKELENQLTDFIHQNLATLFQEHVLWNVVYQLEVIHPGHTQHWYINFSEPDITLQSGTHPLANFFCYITASSLHELIQKRHDWDYLTCSGDYRTFHHIYAMTRWGIIPADSISFKDPLELKFSSSYVNAHHLHHVLAQYSSRSNQQRDTESNPQLNYRGMLQLGNLLIKQKS